MAPLALVTQFPGNLGGKPPVPGEGYPPFFHRPEAMTPDQIAQANASLRDQSPEEIVRWAIAQAGGALLLTEV